MSPPGTGRAERAIRRLALVKPSAVVRSSDWYEWSYPGLFDGKTKPSGKTHENKRRVVWRAAKRAGLTFIGRPRKPNGQFGQALELGQAARSREVGGHSFRALSLPRL